MTGEEIMDVFVDLNREGQTIVLVTHEGNIAAYSRRQVHLHDGVIAEDISSEHVGVHT